MAQQPSRIPDLRQARAAMVAVRRELHDHLGNVEGRIGTRGADSHEGSHHRQTGGVNVVLAGRFADWWRARTSVGDLVDAAYLALLLGGMRVTNQYTDA